MNDITEKPEAESAKQDIALLVEHDPKAVISNPENRDALIAHVRDEIAKQEVDLTTAAGREAVKAFAFKITKTKTALDTARKEITAQAREIIKNVNEGANPTIDLLADLAKEARRPLTDWETAEETRQTECENAIKAFTAAGLVSIDATAADVAAKIVEVEARAIDPARFLGMTEFAIKAKNHSLELLRAAHARIEKAEAEAAELAELRRLRAEDEARRLKEQQAREEAEAKRIADEQAAAKAKADEEAAARRAQEEAEAAKRAEHQAEERRIQAEKDAEAARVRAAEEAAERVREEERQAAAQAQAERDAEAARVLEEERQRTAQLEREAEQRRQADEAAAAARAKAESDMAHRTRCKAEAKESLLTTGITEEEAKAIILLILSDEVPRVTLDFAAEPKVRKVAEASA